MPVHAPRHYKYRFVLVLVAVVAVISLITAAAYKGAVRYVFGHPLADRNVGFTYLEPSYLPDGYRITGKRLWQMRGERHRLERLQAELNIGTKDWIYSIDEQRAVDQPILTTLRNYDPASAGITCTQETSPYGRLYRLCHWTDWGTLSVYEVQFRQDGTFVRTTFPAQKDSVIPTGQFGKFVDSFAPGRPSDLPVTSGI